MEDVYFDRPINLQLFGEDFDEPVEPAGPASFDELPEQISFGETEEGPIVVPRDELRKYYETYSNDTKWQARNTQRAQELAEMEKSMKGRWKNAETLESWISQNPEKYAEIEKMMTSTQQGATGVDPQYQQRLSQLEQIAQEAQKRLDLAQVNDDMKELEKSQAWFFEGDAMAKKRQLVEHAMKGNFPNLHRAFRDLTYDSNAERLANQSAQKRQSGLAANRGLGTPRGSSSTGKKFDARTASEADIIAAMEADDRLENIFD